MNARFSILSAAREHPARIAIVTEGSVLDYAALASRTERRAAALAAADALNPRQPLALLAKPGLASIEVLLAAFEYGVPVLLLHPRLPRDELTSLAARAGAARILDPAEGVTAPVGRSPQRAIEPPSPEDPLVIVPTSGSTGQRKLAVLSRRAVGASAEASASNLPLGDGDRWLLCLPLAHVGGLSIVTRSLAARSAVVTFDPGPRPLLSCVPSLAQAIVRHRVTILSLVPAVLDALLEQDAGWVQQSSLRAVLLGGAATPERLLTRARAAGLPVLTTYGLTEASSQVATTTAGSAPAVAHGVASAGHALPPIELAVGSDGRIRVRGPTLFSGYLGGRSPVDEHGWLVTDDVGELMPSGELFVFGRASERLVTGGENVDPTLVEAVLESLPGVRSACVFGTCDDRFGEVVVCAIVPQESGLDLRRVQRELAARLAPHERPRRVALLAELPLNATGKLDRSRTRDLAQDQLRAWPSKEP